MPTRANGWLYEDYVRALKAARRQGVKSVRLSGLGTFVVEFILDDDYIAKLALRQPPAPAPEPGEPKEEIKLRW